MIDASGQAVTPGFINMLSPVDEALLVDGRALSDLAKCVMLEVMGEGASMGLLSPAMRARIATDQGDLPFKVSGTTLDGFLQTLERRGVSVNVASSVGADAIRKNVLGRDDVRATPSQLKHMRRLVTQAMEDGAGNPQAGMVRVKGRRLPRLSARLVVVTSPLQIRPAIGSTLHY